MTVILLKVLQMSFEASLLIAVLLFFRVIFRKLPKRFMTALWILAAIRLVIPFGIPSPTSLIPEVSEDWMLHVQVEGYFSDEGRPGIAENNDSGLADLSMETSTNPAHPIQGKSSLSQIYSTDKKSLSGNIIGKVISIWSFLFIIWITGACVLILHFAVSTLRIRNMIHTSRTVSRGVYECSTVQTAFVTGLLFPKIILPSGMTETEKRFVIAHEQMHIRHRDHIGKIAAYLILSVHWFNPFVWAAFICYSRDLEFACDENVTSRQNAAYKKGYASVLLKLSNSGQFFLPTAFGKLSVKTRIKVLLSEKKSSRALYLFAGLAVLVIIVCFMTIPVRSDPVSDPAVSISVACSSNPEHKIQGTENPEENETIEFKGFFYWGVDIVRQKIYRLFYLPDTTLPVQERIFILDPCSVDNYTVLTEGLYSGTFVDIQGALHLSDAYDMKTLSLSSLRIAPEKVIYPDMEIDHETHSYLEEKLGILIIYETEDDAWNCIEERCSPTLSEEMLLFGMTLKLKENHDSEDSLELLCTRDASFEAGRTLETGFVYLIFGETHNFENVCYPGSIIELPPGETSIRLNISENPVLSRVGKEPCKIILQYFSQNPAGKSTSKTISCLISSDN